MHKSVETNPRSYHRRDRRTLTERPRYYSTREVTERIADALTDIPAKIIADASGSSLRAAESAKQGIHAMSLTYFLNACQNVPELREVGMALMGCSDVPKADAMRGLAMFLRAINTEEQAK